MGAVFRGRDTRLDRTVAIKVVPSQRRDADALRRFRIEAQAAARLDHPNIARVYYVGEAEAWNYIVFEYIDGINIRDLVARDGPLSIDDAVYYTRQVAEALQHALERDVVHRDIKPSNLLVTSNGHVKLVDMGLARSTSQDRSSADMTASGVTLGTFDYISPEQARDPRDADVRSDLYSLGCTLYFMLTGEPPFPEGTALQKLLSHGSQPPPDPRRFRPELGDELIAIILKLMAKRPAERYQKPVELVGDLMLLADLEQLPKSRLPGSMPVTPTIAQRSLIELHLPWILSAAILILSVFWMQNLESWSTSYALPQPRVTTLEEVSLDSDVSSATPLNPDSNKTATIKSEASSGKNRTGSEQNATLGDNSTAIFSESDNGPEMKPLETLAPTGANSPSLNASGNSSKTGITTSSAASESSIASAKPFKMVDDRYGPEPRNNKPANNNEKPLSPATPPPIAASVPSDINADMKNVETIVVTDDALITLGPNQSRVTNLQEALTLARNFQGIKRIQLAVTSLKLNTLSIPRSGLVIEAAPGFNPVLSFAVESAPVTSNSADTETAAAIIVGNHSVVWRGLEFRLTSIDSMRRGVIWKVSTIANLSLEQCVITLNDPLQRNLLSAIEVTQDSNPLSVSGSISDGSMIDPVTGLVTPGSPREADPLQIRAEDVIIRGEGDWLWMPDAQRAEFRFDNGLIALSGRLLVLGGTSRREARPLTVRLFMDRITCVARGGLAVIDTSSSQQQPICLVRQAAGCSFAVGTATPLVRYILEDEQPLPMAELLQFRGEDNAYDQSIEWVSELMTTGNTTERYSLGNATSDWFQDRALETTVRWVNLSSAVPPLSRHTPENYLQRGSMFIPGFQASRLPRLATPTPATSSSTSISPPPANPPE